MRSINSGEFFSFPGKTEVENAVENLSSSGESQECWLKKIKEETYRGEDLESLKEKVSNTLCFSEGTEGNIRSIVEATFSPLEKQRNRQKAAEVLQEKSHEELACFFKNIGITPKRAALLGEEIKDRSWLAQGFKQTNAPKMHFSVTEGGVRVVYKEKLIDLKSGITIVNPDPDRLSRKEIEDIHDFIVKNKGRLVDLARENGQSIYLSTRQTGLGRSLHFTQDNKVFIHFNKKQKMPIGDRLLGKGAYKVVTTAANLETGELKASMSMRESEAEREMAISSIFQGEEGFLCYEDKLVYTSQKSNEIKTRLLSPIFTRGELFALLQTGELSFLEKEKIMEQVIKAVIKMHSKGIVHRDIKPENILVRGAEQNIEAVLADFGHAMHETDEEKGRKFVGTLYFLSPEYVLHKDDPLSATTKAIDIWALGILLDEIISDGTRQMAPPVFKKKEEAYRAISEYREREEPIDKQTWDYLIWRMLRKNPLDRITAEELSALL